MQLVAPAPQVQQVQHVPQPPGPTGTGAVDLPAVASLARVAVSKCQVMNRRLNEAENHARSAIIPLRMSTDNCNSRTRSAQDAKLLP